MDFLVAFFGSALGVAALQGVFALFTQGRNEKASKGSWVREKKYQIYQEHLQHDLEWQKRINTDGPKGLINPSFFEEWMASYSAASLSLVAPDAVQEAANSYGDDTEEYVSAICGLRPGITEEQVAAIVAKRSASRRWMSDVMRADLDFTDRTYDDQDPAIPELRAIRVPRGQTEPRN